ncbi:MAG: hypothetical protein J4F28_08775 [Nitrosopumilaceae archaeon]|nr:hypothetical protein [Nitrosopumilaceae archaeon]
MARSGGGLFGRRIPLGRRPGEPATLGHTTDIEQSKNAEFSPHMGTLLWLSKHGRVPVEILRRMDIPDGFDMDRVGKAVADLKY